MIPVLKSNCSTPIASIYVVISPKRLIKLKEEVGLEDNITLAEFREAEYERYKARLRKGAWNW